MLRAFSFIFSALRARLSPLWRVSFFSSEFAGLPENRHFSALSQEGGRSCIPPPRQPKVNLPPTPVKTLHGFADSGLPFRLGRRVANRATILTPIYKQFENSLNLIKLQSGFIRVSCRQFGVAAGECVGDAEVHFVTGWSHQPLRQFSPGMMRFMNSSKRGTVKPVSPWLGLHIIPLEIN